VIYGTFDNSTEESAGYYGRQYGEDVMVTINFENLHEPQCKGYDSPGKPKSDFEIWSPHDDDRHGTENKCFLGQKVSYVRRK